MPEGDTIFRTATTLRRWLGERAVTAVSGPPGLDRAVGSTVGQIETRGKHLLIHFDSGIVLHTHMRMTGSWHVYPVGERWRRPRHQARAVITCGDRQAVCFNAPVVKVLADHEVRIHPALNGLGPDVLSDDFDLDEVLRRARTVDPGTLIGELLLDQTVLAGFGNIYRCEALFVRRTNPWKPVGETSAEELAALVTAGQELMSRNARPDGPPGRELATSAEAWVYGRTGRPCHRCGTAIRSELLGRQPRTVHWCPRCQA